MKASLFNKNLLTAVILFSLTACDLDINEDPNNPTNATVSELLPHGQVSVIQPFASLVNAITSSAVQTRVSTRYDNYTVSRTTIDGIWNNNLYSGGLKDLETTIVQGTENEQWHYVGIAKLMKAYTFSLMVDLWNDIPYSEAFNPDFDDPAYDSGSAVYTNLEALIVEAMADLDKASERSPANDDLIYGGDLNKWKRMGNTLLLKMYNQTRLVDDNVGGKIEALIADNNLIQSSDDDFQLVYGNTASPENRMQLFVEDYVTRLDNRISNYFYDVLTDANDPRIPYYLYNQSNTFVGRDAGNPSGLSTFEDQDTRTFHGAYPAGGKYDDGSATVTTGDSGLKGAATYRMMTYAMRLFIEAEAALTLDITASASVVELLEQGIRESMEKVNELGVGPGISESQIDQYVAERLDVFNAADGAGKLEVVMMEKYKHLFGNGMEQYNDWRRTGFPNDLTLVVQTSLVLNRFPYPSSATPPTLPNNNELVFWDK
ncbi:SusD/RagB family nutrient-binding outer membrane lipoprotein [Pricia sp. S334]|uniref:SusD/RagB family nutrient-binding outer membrane lipoprotein n=1 Tax=Pricia mediterranea TaxID=3076079 RepID=A0ABU3L9M3_9FLAO|nr:SusD/RagB family nutrient-binding outer membrane lipoprotein [Pricia sp. S334]MDT7830440.1 SusD/RagB family nutrient-binding outer membrane lipoprotein [Pricia sp. S334]